jgi:formylglycine-generating enzyme required for sulfatase activity
VAIAITLQGIDETIENLPYRNKRTLKYRLVMAVRAHYENDSDLAGLIAIAMDDLVCTLWDTGGKLSAIKNRRKNFSSIKSAVNSDLKKLHRQGKNPEGIIIGAGNIFEMSEEAKEAYLNAFIDKPVLDTEVDLANIKNVLRVVDEMLDAPRLENENQNQTTRQHQTGLQSLLQDIATKVGLGPGTAGENPVVTSVVDSKVEVRPERIDAPPGTTDNDPQSKVSAPENNDLKKTTDEEADAQKINPTTDNPDNLEKIGAETISETPNSGGAGDGKAKAGKDNKSDDASENNDKRRPVAKEVTDTDDPAETAHKTKNTSVDKEKRSSTPENDHTPEGAADTDAQYPDATPQIQITPGLVESDVELEPVDVEMDVIDEDIPADITIVDDDDEDIEEVVIDDDDFEEIAEEIPENIIDDEITDVEDDKTIEEIPEEIIDDDELEEIDELVDDELDIEEVVSGVDDEEIAATGADLASGNFDADSNGGQAVEAGLGDPTLAENRGMAGDIAGPQGDFGPGWADGDQQGDGGKGLKNLKGRRGEKEGGDDESDEVLKEGDGGRLTAKMKSGTKDTADPAPETDKVGPDPEKKVSASETKQPAPIQPAPANSDPAPDGVQVGADTKAQYLAAAPQLQTPIESVESDAVPEIVDVELDVIDEDDAVDVTIVDDDDEDIEEIVVDDDDFEEIDEDEIEEIADIIDDDETEEITEDLPEEIDEEEIEEVDELPDGEAIELDELDELADAESVLEEIEPDSILESLNDATGDGPEAGPSPGVGPEDRATGQGDMGAGQTGQVGLGIGAGAELAGEDGHHLHQNFKQGDGGRPVKKKETGAKDPPDESAQNDGEAEETKKGSSPKNTTPNASSQKSASTFDPSSAEPDDESENANPIEPDQVDAVPDVIGDEELIDVSVVEDDDVEEIEELVDDDLDIEEEPDDEELEEAEIDDDEDLEEVDAQTEEVAPFLESPDPAGGADGEMAVGSGASGSQTGGPQPTSAQDEGSLEDPLEEDDPRHNERLLAEAFNRSLAVRDKYYNQHLFIEGGEFKLGLPIPRKDERPEQIVTLNPFYISKFPVTNALFEVFVEKTGYRTTAEKIGYGTVYKGCSRKSIDKATGHTQLIFNSAMNKEDVPGAFWYQPLGPGSTLHNRRQHPVVQVSFEDAVAFAAWTGKRLPTENEWEAAARATNSNKYPWGSDFNATALNFENSHNGDTSGVERYESFANEWGVADTLGNVWEWTLDVFEHAIPIENDSIWHVAKGGSFLSTADINSASRRAIEAMSPSNIVGFRCVAY